MSLGCDKRDVLMPYLIHAPPAELEVIDISRVEIEEAKKLYESHASFHVMDAHELEFPSSSVDVVVGRSVLHHLDFVVAMREIRRVLKPGGKAIFIEPLGDNPASKVFRWLTPKARTRDEAPLSAKQIQYANSLLGKHEHYFFNFWSTPIGMASSILFSNPDNFWTRSAHRLDTVICKTSLKYWMRAAVLVWTREVPVA